MKAAVDILYPPRCPLCEKILSGPIGRKRLACPECVGKLVLIENPRCLKCGKQLSIEEQEYCGDCARGRHIYERGAAAAAYSDVMQGSVHRFKYKCRREYTSFYVELIMRQCGHLLRQWNVDVIMPVPMYKKKERVRGYNQAALLAKGIGRRMGVEVDCGKLLRVRKTRPMKELNDEERFYNLENAFKIKPDVIKYNRILLVDDIYTTGATIDACAAALKAAGAKKVYFVSLCIGKGF